MATTKYKTILTSKGKEITPSQAGKIAEEFIIKYLSNRDKHTYICRFADTYDANKGRWGDPNQKKVIIPKRPCDVMLIDGGKTYFCEIKTSCSERGLTRSLFSQQSPERTRILKAGGNYAYLIYSVVRENWYFIPAELLDEMANWGELTGFCTTYPEVRF